MKRVIKKADVIILISSPSKFPNIPKGVDYKLCHLAVLNFPSLSDRSRWNW